MRFARRPLLMLSLAAAVALSGAAFNFLVDPYGAWGTGLVPTAFGKINDDRLQIPYLLRTSAPQTVLVGSSRVAWGIPIDEGYRDGVLNAGIPGASLPQIARIVDLALTEPRLKRIVWFVDFFAFSEHFKREDPRFDARMAGDEVAKIEETLFSLDALGDSFDTAKRAIGGRARLRRSRTVAIPWPMKFICRELETRAASDLSTVPDPVLEAQLTRNWYTDYRRSAPLARLFSATIEKAHAHGVETVLVVAPMSLYELEFLRQSGQWQRFQDFKRMLAAVAPFWDFSGYNAIAREDVFFRDATHMKPAVGQMLLRIVLGMDAVPCDAAAAAIAASGRLIDSRDIDTALADQDRMREAAADPGARSTRIAAQVRRALDARDARTSAQTEDQ